jgi:hypothetical protein
MRLCNIKLLNGLETPLADDFFVGLHRKGALTFL